MKTKIHATSIVDPKAEIDAGVDIGPFCIIKSGTRIRKGTKLIYYVVLGGSAEI